MGWTADRARIGPARASHAASSRKRGKEDHALSPHLLCIGGEDHYLRIPFLLALVDRGIKVTAAGTGDGTPFAYAGLDYRSFGFDRFVNPLADLAAIKTLRGLIRDIRPDLVQSFDTKPNLLVPFAARGVGGVAGFGFGCVEPQPAIGEALREGGAKGERPCHRAAARP